MICAMQKKSANPAKSSICLLTEGRQIFLRILKWHVKYVSSLKGFILCCGVRHPKACYLNGNFSFSLISGCNFSSRKVLLKYSWISRSSGWPESYISIRHFIHSTGSGSGILLTRVLTHHMPFRRHGVCIKKKHHIKLW